MISADGSSLLCVEFYADSVDELKTRMAALERDLASMKPRQTRQVLDAAAQQAIWSFREAALGLSTATKTDGKAISFVEDTAVAPEKLRDYIERFIALVGRHNTTAGVYAHASVGCLHVRPVVNLKTAEGVAKFEAIANEVADLVLEFGGALSGEHGDGLVRGAFNEKMFGSELYQAFRQVKKTFDPNGLFNPGRIVDTPPITSHLRYGAGYATPSPATFFDFSDHPGSAAPLRCAAASDCAARSARARCALRTWSRATRRIRRAAAPTRCGSRWPANWATRSFRTKACTRSWISASNAAPARVSARSASMWRDSRASSSPATGIGIGCRSRRTRSEARMPLPSGAAASRRVSNRSRTATRRDGPPRS